MILAAYVEIRDELNQNHNMKPQEVMIGTTLKRLGLPE